MGDAKRLKKLADDFRLALQRVPDPDFDRMASEEFVAFRSWIEDVIQEKGLRARLLAFLDEDPDNEIVMRRIVEEYLAEE